MPGKPVTGVKPWHWKKKKKIEAKCFEKDKVHRKRSKVLQKIDAKCIKTKLKQKGKEEKYFDLS